MTSNSFGSTSSERVRIVIADDHPVVRAGLRRELENEPNLEIVGEAENGELALAAIRTLAPDILLLDINMPVMNGIEVMNHLNQNETGAIVLKPRVLVLSTYHDPIYVFTLIAAGANGYLLKHESGAKIISGIAQVMRGEPALSIEIQRLLLNRQQISYEQLTIRERDILQLVASGYSDLDIATKLGISSSTVRNHITNIYGKLPGIASRAEAVTWAWQNGLMKG